MRVAVGPLDGKRLEVAVVMSRYVSLIMLFIL